MSLVQRSPHRVACPDAFGGRTPGRLPRGLAQGEGVQELRWLQLQLYVPQELYEGDYSRMLKGNRGFGFEGLHEAHELSSGPGG